MRRNSASKSALADAPKSGSALPRKASSISFQSSAVRCLRANERQQPLFLGAHVVPVERRVRLHGFGERGKFAGAARAVARQRLFQRADLLRPDAMLGLELLDQRHGVRMAPAQQAEQIGSFR